MADGRILSKRISRSDKVSALSTDTARMIYSWIIPYLDVEGRMEANPRLMKSDIAPLLDHITPLIIQEILNELNNIGLVVLYQSENKQYLQLVKFDENQPNLRKDREKKSQIPKAPAKVKQEKTELRQDSGEAPAEVPHKINIREVNIREAKGTPEQPQPVDNSPKKKPALIEKQEEENPETEFGKQELRNLVNQIQCKYPKLPILKFLQSHNHDHPLAIIHTLKSLLDHEIKVPEIPVLIKYLEVIIASENGKYNARDSENRCNEFKKGGMESIGHLLAGIKTFAEAH